MLAEDFPRATVQGDIGEPAVADEEVVALKTVESSHRMPLPRVCTNSVNGYSPETSRVGGTKFEQPEKGSESEE